MNALRFKESPVGHNEYLLLINVQREALVGYLFAVYFQRERNEIVVAAVIGVRTQGHRKISALHHGDEERFGYGSQNGVVCGQLLRPARKRESL